MSAWDELTAVIQRGPGQPREGRRATAAAALTVLIGLFAGLMPVDAAVRAALSTALCLGPLAYVGWVSGARWAWRTGVLASLACSLPEFYFSVFDRTTCWWVSGGRTLLLLQFGSAGALLRSVLERASQAAETDRMTGMLNKAGFRKRLTAEANRARRSNWPLAIGFIDCDDFKGLNDARGHQAGDAVLRLTAESISENIRNYDSAGRFGGDEFVVLWPVRSAAGAKASAARLHESLTRTVRDAGYDVTFSLGLAVFEEIPEDAEVLRSADELMYAAKQAGKGRVVSRIYRGEQADEDESA